MRRISIFIAEPQYDGLLTLAERQGRPYAELIREALEAYLRDAGTRKAASRRAVTRRKASSR